MHIAFLASSGGRFEIGVMNVDGSDQRVFLPEGLFAIDAIAWSPDGTQLGLVGTDARQGGFDQLWVAAADGSGLRQVAPFDRWIGGLAWRPISPSSLPVCDFNVGDTLTFGSVGAVVPPPGQGVTGVADGTHGGSSITIETSADGVVTVQPGDPRCRLAETPP
jgi:hypothetical protein